jgi:hypothetical protein
MSASQTNCAAYPHAYEIIEPPKFETSYEYVPYLMHDAVGGNSQLALGGKEPVERGRLDQCHLITVSMVHGP